MELIHPEQLREFESAVEHGVHRILADRGYHTRLDRRRGRRAYRRAVETGGAEEQSRLQHPDHGLAALVGDDAFLDAAVLQIIDRPGGLTLLEDDLAGLVSCDSFPLADLGQERLRVESRGGHWAWPCLSVDEVGGENQAVAASRSAISVNAILNLEGNPR